MKEIEVTWEDVNQKIRLWNFSLEKNEETKSDVVLAVAKGGVVPGYAFSKLYWKEWAVPTPKPGKRFKVIEPFVPDCLMEFKGKKVILVDDIYDSGATAEFFKKEAEKWGIHMTQLFIIDKRSREIQELIASGQSLWYRFPWETKVDTAGGREQATVALLRSIGEDSLREGLKDTPKRVGRMWDELTAGYDQNPEEILKTSFSIDTYDQMVLLKDIDFYSLCEHHMLPFYGCCHFAYIPDKAVVGISKIPRLINAFSRRLQIQEQMTEEIGKTFQSIVKPKGVALVVEAVHLCMVVRGVKQQNAKMITSYLGGVFKKEADTRNEFLRLIGK